MYQLSFSLSEFLTQYWQKKPTIIKKGFQNFQDPMSPDELAGLTMEEEVDSRFVANLNDQWIAEHGPFNEDKFAQLGETNWSFIVQAANHWHQGAAQLVKPFQTMPQWLFDDLMISYSVPDGGVGPHIDQYDVFIIQGSGKRHWRVGDKDIGQYKEVSRHAALRQIESFEPIIDDILEPGDILYIPPGFPHDGYALEPSMSYSIGFRSPKEQELISNFADYVLANDMGDVHMHNPDLATQNEYGVINKEAREQLVHMLLASLQDKTTINDFLGSTLSQSRHQLDIVVPAEPWEAEEVQQHLINGGDIHKVAGLRALYHDNEPGVAYINGEMVKVGNEEQTLLTVLCNKDSFTAQDIINSQAQDEPLAISASSIALICEQINKGYWFIED
ncbi:50S ribosomal protein L16 arginine hydroxylase [Vibrio sp. 10N.286.49.B3]|uniref:cupin domain-containing protein n=1 Tax=Vibrio sp. 10N.286.49.B3 TaxID=1880855 RepID=UPI000C86237B|nr:cupin domain-containing protein [Vibrio sp. 10N.286.49.B3]PMH44984.1 50S ribosomal protein L16 arginine hydroxylase [Vibrio sp. 10N.286.49.B3]